jgi:hypothetical protein
MRMSLLTLLAAGSVLASGCSAIVTDRVAAGLIEAGLPERMAHCMAPIWAERLSVRQIRRISQLGAEVRADGGSLTAFGLIDRVRRMNDPEAVQVVTSSAARCALA